MLKHRAEAVLASRFAGWLSQPRRRGQRLILAYHGIVPAGARPAGERSLVLPVAEFARQLDILGGFADVVALSELDAVSDGDRPRVAITFDDAYQGAVTAGVAELAARGLPATFFVAPGRLGGHAFWWDVLAHGSGALDAATRTHALEALRGVDESVQTWAAVSAYDTADALPQYARSATRAELRAAVASGAITVASHSWSHANLARLSGPELDEELVRSLCWLRAEFGARALPWLAYPYGCETAETRRAAHAAGYTGAVLIAGGWHLQSHVSPLARPRLNVPGSVSAAGFRARLLATVR